MAEKDMLRSEWTRIRRKEQIILPFFCAYGHGKISLLKMLEVSEPFCRIYGGKEIVLADNGYYWLQLALDGSHAWFTVMFDDRGRFLQIYVDVTDGNDTDKDNPSFTDLYLDFVVYDGRLYELDRSELNAALAAAAITPEQYRRAREAGAQVKAFLLENLDSLPVYFTDKLNELIVKAFLLENLDSLPVYFTDKLNELIPKLEERNNAPR